LAKEETRINHRIRARELRVIGPEGENFGVLSLEEALSKAEELSLDLIELSPNANPPVAKITDFGKYQYEENKKQKIAKSKAHTVEVKSVQIKIGTGDHDLELKAKKASEWLSEGHKIKIDLFLPGRSKYLDQNFLGERLERFLKFISAAYKVTEPAKKSPKGISCTIERQK